MSAAASSSIRTAEAEYEECLLKARFAVGDQWIAR